MAGLKLFSDLLKDDGDGQISVPKLLHKLCYTALYYQKPLLKALSSLVKIMLCLLFIEQ